MYNAGKISNLSFKSQGFWSEERKLAHIISKDAHLEKSVKGGGCEEGAMVGIKRDEHYQSCAAGGGCEEGAMVGTKRDEHTKKSMKGDARVHIVKVVAGHEKKNALLLQLANSKLKQGPEWTESCRKNGSGVIYTFTNGIDDPIEGKGDFEAHLLESYMPEELTEDGKSA